LRRESGIKFVLPALSVIGLVAIFPVFYVFYLSLHKKVLTFNISAFTGFDNYTYLLTDSRFWNALKNTAYFTGVSVSLELLLGLSIAVLLNRAFKGKGFMRAVVLIPWTIPTVVSAKMWEWIYNTDFGILNYMLGIKINWLGNTSWAIHAAIFMDVWKTTPFVALILIAGLQVIPKDLYSAARVDGAGSWYIFGKITLPLLMPAILIVLIFRTLDAFRVFDAVYVLTGGGPANTTETLSIYAYKVLFQLLQFGYGSTLSVIVFLCVGLISIFYVKLLSTSVHR
jgi:multiple sugar transport system permease protein